MGDDEIRLIGLSGAIDVGKSIVVKHWCDSYGCAEFIFKNVMVQCLAHIFEGDRFLFHDCELKENPHDSFVWPLTQGGDADLWH
ncbi:hypothetical protein [Nitrosomonas sp. Nm34]|uniref:hypothetical protein n=1 Tax=Nitrosomonas sp. Nm34 TaxID=1881055 RepID=UPI0008E366C0|nr:hypothetical protein [Nitrosomonas sp. Nm34]SFJ06498.1 hypothetical protein SAMN05428978_10946 [Nitrosomonas sp. Nm34]